jgi:hypothetical protein
MLFGVLLYNEIIILPWCGLDVNTERGSIIARRDIRVSEALSSAESFESPSP